MSSVSPRPLLWPDAFARGTARLGQQKKEQQWFPAAMDGMLAAGDFALPASFFATEDDDDQMHNEVRSRIACSLPVAAGFARAALP